MKQLCLGETCGVLIWKWAQPVLQYVPGWLPFVLPHLSELLHCAKLVFKLAKILAVFPSLWVVGFEIVLYLASLQVKLDRLMLLPFSCEVATCSWLSLGEYYAMFVSFIVKTNTTTRRQPNTRKRWRLTLKKKKKSVFYKDPVSIAFCLFSLLGFSFFNPTIWIAIQEYIAHRHVNLALTFLGCTRAGGYCLIIIITAILQNPELC